MDVRCINPLDLCIEISEKSHALARQKGRVVCRVRCIEKQLSTRYIKYSLVPRKFNTRTCRITWLSLEEHRIFIYMYVYMYLYLCISMYLYIYISKKLALGKCIGISKTFTFLKHLFPSEFKPSFRIQNFLLYLTFFFINRSHIGLFRCDTEQSISVYNTKYIIQKSL